MPSLGVGAEKFLHLDGWNGWRIARASAEIEQTESGLSLRRGQLPAPSPTRLAAARPAHRGLAFDRAGRPIAVDDAGNTLCKFRSCDPVPAAWGLDAGVESIGGMAIDGHGRLFLTLPDRGELRVLRLSPPGEIARIPADRPSSVAVDANAQVYVLEAQNVLVLSPSLRPLRRLSVPDGESIAASARGALLVARGGSPIVHVAPPGGPFEQVDLGRPALPAVAFDPADLDDGHVLIGDEPSGRIVKYRLGPLTPIAWSREDGPFAALALRSAFVPPDAQNLFALGARCSVTPISFEDLGFRARSGVVILGPLDAGSPNIEWHRITAALHPQPERAVGVSVEVLTSDDCDAFDLDGRWGSARELSAPRSGRPAELALLEAKGRYAYLRLTLRGDGRRAPTLRWLRVEYPRRSYLRYLPGVYSEDPVSRELTARFLSIFEAENADLSQSITDLPRLFRPFSVDPEFLPWLAERIDLLLDERWSVEKQREVLSSALSLYRRRGTRAAFETFLSDYGAPGLHVVEGFQAGASFILGNSSVTGCNTILAGGCAPPRMVLGRGFRLGQAKLDSRPFAEADPLTEQRGLLAVYVPPAASAAADTLARIERIALAEAPAGAEVRVIPVDIGFRLGSARVGISASLGTAAPFRLPEEGERPRAGAMLLTPEPGKASTLALGQGPRLGMNSTL